MVQSLFTERWWWREANGAVGSTGECRCQRYRMDHPAEGWNEDINASLVGATGVDIVAIDVAKAV